MSKILVAMSGGVDSSVAAAILKKQGHDVIGITMQLWDYSKNKVKKGESFDSCCSLDDVAEARMVAHHLDIPFYVLDYQKDFQENVVDYFVDSYIKGKTPNPCVACNTFLKFDILMERAKRLGCEYVATGHYAQISSEKGFFSLLQAVDKNKDQSYFLYSLTQERLKSLMFPLGEFTKSEVRQMALDWGLPNAQKKESMEICFIPNNDYGAFIEEHVSPSRLKKGSLIHESGEVLGEHGGIHLFTVGQRKGIGIHKTLPLFVTRIESETGNVYVGEENYLWRKGFFINSLHQIRPWDVDPAVPLTVKIRYRSQAYQAHVQDIQINGLSEVIFNSPQKSVAPGQIAVFYSPQEEVLGGGFIESVI